MFSLTRKVFLTLTLLFTTLGASKCKEEPPPPPQKPKVEGSWKWSCVETAPVTEQEVALALSCAQQVPPNSAFMNYVGEYLIFDETMMSWEARFAFGTCVDRQEGKFQMELKDKKYVLDILDSQNQIVQSYDVKEVDPNTLEFAQASRVCTLKKSVAPEVLRGGHPRPQNVNISWDLRIDGSIMFWSSQAQFPFVYQSPQIQAASANPSPYRVEYAVLHIGSDGSRLEDYAAQVLLYEKSGVAPIARSEVKTLSPGVMFVVEYTEADGSIVKLSAQF